MFNTKFLISTLVLIAIFSCKKAEVVENTTELAQVSTEIDAKDVEAIEYTEYVLSELAEKAVQNWVEFMQLKDNIDLVKQTDLSFLNDMALLTSFFKDLKNAIPQNIDKSSINVRLTVLETASFKLESINNLSNVSKELKLEYIKELLVSYSNLIFQINKELEKESQIIGDQF